MRYPASPVVTFTFKILKNGLSYNCKLPTGCLRIKTKVIKQEREKGNHPVLVLDAGDFLMGSLFHMLAREEAMELRLMKDMGYDVLTLGNHEFDLKPKGLARILHSAAARGGMPPILDVIPKDRNGNPMDDFAALRVDADRSQAGIHELKEWVGLMEYVMSFPDINGDGVPDVPNGMWLKTQTFVIGIPMIGRQLNWGNSKMSLTSPYLG